MQIKRKRAKHIGINKNFVLVPNFSFGIFLLGDDINKYLYRKHTVLHNNYNSFSTVVYEFYKGRIDVWIRDEDDNKIWSIRTNFECFWKEKNLIGMYYDDFLKLAGIQPDNISVEYVLINKNRGQNQNVYEFDKLGIMLWVWRRKIKTIIIAKNIED